MYSEETLLAYELEKMATEHFQKVAKMANDIQTAVIMGQQLAYSDIEKRAGFLGAIGSAGKAIGGAAKSLWKMPTWKKGLIGTGLAAGTIGTVGAVKGIGAVAKSQSAANQLAQHGAYQYGAKTPAYWKSPYQM